MNHHVRDITLDDKYVLETGTVYMTGIQALVRLGLDQIRHDKAAGLNTAGFISGYRGSPLGGYDQQLSMAKKFLKPLNVIAEPGLNEELAMTAVWGTQKLGLNVPSNYDGVFGIWYGKAPGVDRSTDVLKHANNSGTHKNGGVLALAGDDILAKSSTLACQSDWVFANCEVPFFNPADLQDVLDYGLHGIALSRYSGLWVGLICLADTMDSSGLLKINTNSPNIQIPLDIPNPRDTIHNGGYEVNRQMVLKGRLDMEYLLRKVKLPSVSAYIRANKLNRIVYGSQNPSILLVATGKAYRDLRQALDLLGIDEYTATQMGIGIFKVAMPYPLEPQEIQKIGAKAERVIFIEHKRSLMEMQFKDDMYHMPDGKRPLVFGKTDILGNELFTSIGELSPHIIAKSLLNALPNILVSQEMMALCEHLNERVEITKLTGEVAKRSPYFCSGCPHNTSTNVPEGSLAMAGIGCHIMTEFADRTAEGSTAMGGEGVPWIGMRQFSPQKHIFANMGDGTYFHSGILAIRYAVAMKTPITYKILYNDAVAMTGGQNVDGELTVPQLTRQMASEGVKKIVVISEYPENYEGDVGLAPNVEVYSRDELMTVQKNLREFLDTSVLIYDQTCASEKRRRRKRGLMPKIDTRILINDRVCEGCGDCSVQSNCMSVEPMETDFGQKRTINQSSCNQDFSCIKGFCPSFVSVTGGKLRKSVGVGIDIGAHARTLPEPVTLMLNNTYDCLFTGVGGMGVTTAAAVLAMSAHVQGINTLTLDMTGLAQKGGPVVSHVRFAPALHEIHGAHVPVANADVLFAADMLVASQTDQLLMMHPNRTHMVANTQIAPTAEFTKHRTQNFNKHIITENLRKNVKSFEGADFAKIAEKLLGDTLYANMMLIGFAMQKGLLPVSLNAMETAITLNGAAVENNKLALSAGRILAITPDIFSEAISEKTTTRSLDEQIEFYEKELELYQNVEYSVRYKKNIEKIREIDTNNDKLLTATVAKNLYKLMAIKDEYEVARLYTAPEFKQKLAAQFEGNVKLSLSLAPPLISKIDTSTGRPQKRQFGAWIFPVFQVMAKLKHLRGTVFDIFGMTSERKMERGLLVSFEQQIARIVAELNDARYDLAVLIADLPQDIRGFGPVKHANVEAAKIKEAAFWAKW